MTHADGEQLAQAEVREPIVVPEEKDYNTMLLGASTALWREYVGTLEDVTKLTSVVAPNGFGDLAKLSEKSRVWKLIMQAGGALSTSNSLYEHAELNKRAKSVADASAKRQKTR